LGFLKSFMRVAKTRALTVVYVFIAILNCQKRIYALVSCSSKNIVDMQLPNDVLRILHGLVPLYQITYMFHPRDAEQVVKQLISDTMNFILCEGLYHLSKVLGNTNSSFEEITDKLVSLCSELPYCVLPQAMELLNLPATRVSCSRGNYPKIHGNACLSLF
jgi:hypothetical protein